MPTVEEIRPRPTPHFENLYFRVDKQETVAGELEHMQSDTCGLVYGSLGVAWVVSGNVQIVYAAWTIVRRETLGWTYTSGQQELSMSRHTKI